MIDKKTGIHEPTVEPMVKIPEWLNVHQRPMKWLQILCRLTGTAFTTKDGIKYGDHSVFKGSK